MVTDWSNLEIARAALADPTMPPSLLLPICQAQPALRAEAAMHPAADANLLAWLAAQDDPVVSATAQARLATLPPTQAPPPPTAFLAADPVRPSGPAYIATLAPAAAPPHSAIQPGTQPKPRRSRKGLIVALSAGALVLALGATAAVVLPRLLSSSGSYTYAPDFRERPGILAVDARAGLPQGDAQSWGTSFTTVAGTGIVVGYNSTDAFADYRQQLADYTEAVAAYSQWETAYNAGFDQGKGCLRDTVDPGWFSSVESYCAYHSGDYSNTDTTAGQAGFSDAVENYPATPEQPGSSYYEVPQVPDKPKAPTIGDNLVGIELKTGRTLWTLDLATLWPDRHPSAAISVDGDRLLLTLADPLDEDAGDAPRLLALVDARTGASRDTREYDYADLHWAELHGDVVVTCDEDGNLHGISASQLENQVWTSSAKSLDSSESSYSYGLKPPPGYLLTQDGYLKTADGTMADFARDAGQDGIQLTVLDGTTDSLIRVETREDSYDVAGFDPGSNQRTWQLDELSSTPRKAGGLLLATSDDEVTAYRINGSDLERKWRHSCAGSCWLGFADDSRVFINDYTDDRLVIVKTEDGSQLDSIRDEGGYGPTVGTTVAYLRTNDRLIAYDLSKDGTPTLWRSSNLGGWLTVFDGSLVLVDDNRLGILGLSADDWDAFKPTNE